MTNPVSVERQTPLLLTLAALVIVIAGLKVAAPLIAQFLMALFIAVVSTPSIRWLVSKKVPQSIAIIAVLLAILLFVSLIVYLVGDSVQSFNENREVYASKLQSQLSALTAWMVSVGLPAEGIEIASIIEKTDIMALVTRVIGGLGVIFSDFFVIFLSVIFILSEITSFPSKFARAFSNSQDKMVHVNHVLGKIRHYLAIKTAASIGTGILISILMVIIGVDYPFLWGMLAFLLNYIPNIGSIIAAIPALMLALVQLGPAAVLWTAISFFAVNNLVGNYLEPKFMGKMLGLSTFVVFLSLIFWGWIFGSVGMFLSVPLTMTIKIALETNDKTRWLAIMLGPEE
ncbi:AI-2E family transporter [Aliikangiella coralliicola]|uniref:AI-2E family transporter n=1 Tax=Aliikangiella coralliicola TaxID=2592383 RepID=A0A545UJI9_9GAMM|nr:AI-2E family transporter [Aliikangiella coralliicola]TQV89635.1 AI-2E family transporter [Aliikangiella coralliicola]